MNRIVRALGSVLRLVGVSSPEDAAAKGKDASGPPSWRDSKTAESGPRKQ